jgi:hypothetical protein
MSTCKGDVPITTKVDEATRDLVDKVAEEKGSSRAQVLRQLLELYHQSVDGDLECPSCTQTIRVEPADGGLAAEDPADTAHTEGKDGAVGTEIGPETMADSPNTEDTVSPNIRQEELTEIQSTIESQQQELELLRQKMTAHEREIAEIWEQRVSPERIDYLEGQAMRTSDEIERIVPRIEALTEVSELTTDGKCPDCGDSLTFEQSIVGFGERSPIKCTGCERIVGHTSE